MGYLICNCYSSTTEVGLNALPAVCAESAPRAAGAARDTIEHVSNIARLLNNDIDFTAWQMAEPEPESDVCDPPAALAVSSPPIEIYPPKMSPTQEWIIRFILSFRNFYLEGFESSKHLRSILGASFINIFVGHVTGWLGDRHLY